VPPPGIPPAPNIPAAPETRDPEPNPREEPDQQLPEELPIAQRLNPNRPPPCAALSASHQILNPNPAPDAPEQPVAQRPTLPRDIATKVGEIRTNLRALEPPVIEDDSEFQDEYLNAAVLPTLTHRSYGYYNFGYPVRTPCHTNGTSNAREVTKYIMYDFGISSLKAQRRTFVLDSDDPTPINCLSRKWTKLNHNQPLHANQCLLLNGRTLYYLFPRDATTNTRALYHSNIIAPKPIQDISPDYYDFADDA